MHDFRYVSKKEAAPIKAILLEIIHSTQNLVRDEFTFQYEFVGSASRNMITCDTKSNIGFDFDVNIYVNDDEENYTAKQIRQIIKQALDEVARHYPRSRLANDPAHPQSRHGGGGNGIFVNDLFFH